MSVLSEPVRLGERILIPSISIPFVGDITVTGRESAPCEQCGGNGTVTETRERRIDELYDKQIRVLFEADMYREHGDEEQREEMRKRQRRLSSTGPSNPMNNPEVHSQLPNH